MNRAKLYVSKNCATHIVCAAAALFVLDSCVSNSVRSPADIENSGALLKTAVGDAEDAASRARIYHNANIWNRADKELDESQVILTKARDARERIRRAYRAAVALLAELQTEAGGGSGQNRPATSPTRAPDLAAAADRVDRIGAALAEADRDVEKIERSVVSLLELDIPNRR